MRKRGLKLSIKVVKKEYVVQGKKCLGILRPWDSGIPILEVYKFMTEWLMLFCFWSYGWTLSPMLKTVLKIQKITYLLRALLKTEIAFFQKVPEESNILTRTEFNNNTWIKTCPNQEIMGIVLTNYLYITKICTFCNEYLCVMALYCGISNLYKKWRYMNT